MTYAPQPRPKCSRLLHSVLFGLLGMLALVAVLGGLDAFLGHGTGSEATPHKAVPASSDITLSVRVTKQKCYGSGIGCAVSFRPDAGYIGPDLGHDKWVATYEVTGVESGGGVGHIVLTGHTATNLREWHVRTKSHSTVIRMNVTGVEQC